MNEVQRPVQVLARLAIVAGVLFVLHPGNIHAADRPPQDVNVVNAPNVHVVNTPSVNVTNPVTIDTSANPVAVRDVREAGRVLFQWSGSVLIPFEEVTGFTSLNVPAGKRLVVQYASVQAVADPGQRMRAEIQGLVQGTSTAFYLPLNDLGAWDTAQIFQGTQPIQLVSDSTVFFILRRSTVSGNSWLSSVSLSGYLEDLP